MPHISIATADTDNLSLYYEDYGAGQPIILIHGWPLTHRAWEPQFGALVSAGYRVIAYDRRGFGASDKPWEGYDYGTLTADLHGLITALHLEKPIIAGFSMGGGEVARYIGTYGTDNLKAAMLISAVTPYMEQTEDNPNGAPAEIFDGMRNAVINDRYAFIAEWRKNFMNYGDNKETVSQELIDFLWQLSLPALPKAMHDCITAFGSTDFRDDLKKATLPVLLVHGDSDNICPAEICADRAAELLPDATYEKLKDAPHGLNITHRDELNNLMIDFIQKLA